MLGTFAVARVCAAYIFVLKIVSDKFQPKGLSFGKTDTGSDIIPEYMYRYTSRLFALIILPRELFKQAPCMALPYSAGCVRHLWMQGGSRTSGHGLRDFLKLEAQHWPIKLKEFVLDPKRAHAAMSRYRAKRSCWDRTIADFLRRMAKVRF